MKDSVDYKKKYLDLRAKMVSSMDLAFRMGYEKATSDAALQQAQAQMQQQAAMMQGQQSPQQAPAEQQMQEQASDEQQMPQEGQEQGQSEGAPEELDEHIQELESLIGKNDLSADSLKKAIDKIKNVRTNTELAKSTSGTRSFKLNPRAAANLSSNDKKNLSIQEQVIENIMKKWEEESPKTANQAMQALGVEALTKGE